MHSSREKGVVSTWRKDGGGQSKKAVWETDHHGESYPPWAPAGRNAVVDMIPQGNATSGLDRCRQVKSLHHELLIGTASRRRSLSTAFKNVDVLPSSMQSPAPMKWWSSTGGKAGWKSGLAALRDAYDYLYRLSALPRPVDPQRPVRPIPARSPFSARYALEGLSQLMASRPAGTAGCITARWSWKGYC